MIKIDLQNIQAITTAEIIIRENTITVFSGDNSNGKSILSKVIQAVTSGDIKNKDIRRSLIKDGAECGIISFIRDNTQLAFILKEEVSQSFVLYNDDVKDESRKIIRGLNDKTGMELLCKKFGFRTYADGDICLQLSPTFGAIPFVTTSGRVNADIVQDITVDRIAQNFLDSFKTITYPTFKQSLANMKREKEHVEKTLEVIEDYNWREYEQIADEMQSIMDVIRSYSFVKLDHLQVPPKVEFYNVIDCNLRKLHIPEMIPPFELLDKVHGVDELVSMRNGVCPTCGKLLCE